MKILDRWSGVFHDGVERVLAVLPSQQQTSLAVLLFHSLCFYSTADQPSGITAWSSPRGVAGCNHIFFYRCAGSSKQQLRRRHASSDSNARYRPGGSPGLADLPSDGSHEAAPPARAAAGPDRGAAPPVQLGPEPARAGTSAGIEAGRVGAGAGLPARSPCEAEPSSPGRRRLGSPALIPATRKGRCWPGITPGGEGRRPGPPPPVSPPPAPGPPNPFRVGPWLRTARTAPTA